MNVIFTFYKFQDEYIGAEKCQLLPAKDNLLFKIIQFFFIKKRLDSI